MVKLAIWKRTSIQRKFTTTTRLFYVFLGLLLLQLISDLKFFILFSFYSIFSKHFVFRVYRGIRIWDSGNPLVEEYIRSCFILERDEPHSSRTYDSFYFNCNDFIHTGYSALSQATQIIFNYICIRWDWGKRCFDVCKGREGLMSMCGKIWNILTISTLPRLWTLISLVYLRMYSEK
jgi:hypothetical protein